MQYLGFYVKIADVADLDHRLTVCFWTPYRLVGIPSRVPASWIFRISHLSGWDCFYFSLAKKTHLYNSFSTRTRLAKVTLVTSWLANSQVVEKLQKKGSHEWSPCAKCILEKSLVRNTSLACFFFLQFSPKISNDLNHWI